MKPKNLFATRIVQDWERLAVELDIRHETYNTWEKGYEGLRLWDYLKATNQLDQLTGALDSIGRNDLAIDLINNTQNNTEELVNTNCETTNLETQKQKMKSIYLYWSGKQSLEYAKSLKVCLTNSTKPLLNSKIEFVLVNVENKHKCLATIKPTENSTDACIVLITPENSCSQQLLFFLGAISMALSEQSVFKLLVSESGIESNLSAQNGIPWKKQSIKKIITHLLPDFRNPDLMDKLIDSEWDQLEQMMSRSRFPKISCSPSLMLENSIGCFEKRLIKEQQRDNRFNKLIGIQYENIIRQCAEQFDWLNRKGEFHTSYWKCTVLTEAIASMGSGDYLLGTTVWSHDKAWWDTVDAEEFIQANKRAILSGASIARIFIYDKEETLNQSALRSAIDQHKDLGVNVFALRSDQLSPTDIKAAAVISTPPTETNGKFVPVLGYEAERDITKGIHLNRFTIGQNSLSHLYSRLDALRRSASTPENLTKED